ncbi:unnamed protein product, partial [Arctogadus glacialis]
MATPSSLLINASLTPTNSTVRVRAAMHSRDQLTVTIEPLSVHLSDSNRSHLPGGKRTGTPSSA